MHMRLPVTKKKDVEADPSNSETVDDENDASWTRYQAEKEAEKSETGQESVDQEDT